VTHFKYLVSKVTNQNVIQEVNSGNACYNSVQNLLSSRLLSNNVKSLIHNIVILSVVLYGFESWSLTLREDHRLSVFDNRVLRR
jgi:hypothetical protein